MHFKHDRSKIWPRVQETLLSLLKSLLLAHISNPCPNAFLYLYCIFVVALNIFAMFTHTINCYKEFKNKENKRRVFVSRTWIWDCLHICSKRMFHEHGARSHICRTWSWLHPFCLQHYNIFLKQWWKSMFFKLMQTYF